MHRRPASAPIAVGSSEGITSLLSCTWFLILLFPHQAASFAESPTRFHLIES